MERQQGDFRGTEEPDPWCVITLAPEAATHIDLPAIGFMKSTRGDRAGDTTQGDRGAEER